MMMDHNDHDGSSRMMMDLGWMMCDVGWMDVGWLDG